jgi:signal transduction histidine kinase
MRIGAWSRDTIAARFAWTVVVAVVTALALVRLFFVFGGVWANEPLDHSALRERVGDTVRMIEAAPPDLRARLAVAAGTPGIAVQWYAAATDVATTLRRDSGLVTRSRSLQNSLLGDLRRTALVFEPAGALAPPPQLTRDQAQSRSAYFLAIQLADASWLVCSVPHRTWGLSAPQRWAVWLLFVSLSIATVCTIATRRLVRPIKQLAAAVRRFGVNPQAPALAEAGPQEFREVISAFNTMQAQIQKFVAYRTMMLAAISHDLRTPLTRVRLRGELIEDETQQAKLFRDVDEMQTMVDGALAFFRGDADEEATTTFDLAGVLQTITNDYTDQGIAVSYAGPAHAVYCGRPFALKRAFSNLIENAVKYATPPEVELFCRDQAVSVAVRDRGPGIPPEALEKVFTPFFRVDRSRNRATGGVGLGLTAAQAIISGHGGDISLCNQRSGGLEALVTLPHLA